MDNGRPIPAPARIGIDVTSVSRVAAAMQRHPRMAERIFTPAERGYCAGHAERWAARWAVKEAVRKLLGAGGRRRLPAYAAIEVRRSRSGAPSVAVEGSPMPFAISITHDGDVAIAVAVAVEPRGIDMPCALPPPDLLRLPDRPVDAHKGTFGTVVVLAGAHGFSGAAYLTAMGAARGGAGLVRLCVPQQLHAAVAVKCTEVMAHALPDDGLGAVGQAAVEHLLAEHLPVADALVAGPGLGRASQTESALRALLAHLTCPTVLDADALNIVAAAGLHPAETGRPVIVTPHPAEMGRLAGVGTADVQSRRERVAREYAFREGVVVVLKGSQTVIASPDGRTHVDEHRVVALASGGTGDVLAGLCGAMLAAGLDPFDAAVAAVTVHAEAGAAVEAERGRAGALATDVLDALPAAQERVRRAIESRPG